MIYVGRMNEKTDTDELIRSAMSECFGALSLKMLNETDLRHAWRINFLANFFVGPVYRKMAEQHDISRPEFVILYGLTQEPGLVARDICMITGLPKNSISRAVSILLKKGFIRRQTGETDKREKPLEITAQGQKKLETVKELFSERQNRMRASLSEKELEVFDSILMKMIYTMPAWVDR